MEPLAEARFALAVDLVLADEDRAELRASVPFELAPVMLAGVFEEEEEAVVKEGDSLLALPRDRREYGEVLEVRPEGEVEAADCESVF